MRGLILISIIALVAINGLYGQEKEKAQEEPKVNLKVVYEKTFDEEILDVIFDTATVSIEEAKKMGWKEEAFTEEEKLKREVQISYPKVIIAGKKGYPAEQTIKFLDKNGNIKKIVLSERTSRIVISSNGKYILKALWYNSNTDSGGGAILYDNDSNVIWEKSEGAFYAVTDNGYVGTGFVSPEGSWYPFMIFDSFGNKIKEILLPEWHIFDSGITANGEYFVITYKGKAGFDSTGIMVIERDGKKSFETIIEGNVYPWNILPIQKGVLLIMRSGKHSKFVFIDQDGNIMWQKEIPVYVGGNPSLKDIDGEHYIWMMEYGHLLRINISDGKIEFHKNLASNLRYPRYSLKLCGNILFAINKNKLVGLILKEVLK